MRQCRMLLRAGYGVAVNAAHAQWLVLTSALLLCVCNVVKCTCLAVPAKCLPCPPAAPVHGSRVHTLGRPC